MNTENKIQIDDYVLNYSYHKKDPHKPPRVILLRSPHKKGLIWSFSIIIAYHVSRQCKMKY